MDLVVINLNLIKITIYVTLKIAWTGPFFKISSIKSFFIIKIYLKFLIKSKKNKDKYRTAVSTLNG